MKKSRKILIGILICVIIGSVFYIGYYYVTQNKNEKVYKKLQKEVVKQERVEIGRARVGKECRSRWSPYH